MSYEQFIFVLTEGMFFLVMGVIMVWVVITLLFLVVSRNRPKSNFTCPLSVIIPAYNEEKNIKECVESVKNSDYNEKIEIIVVDDGSKDHTAEVAEKAGAKVIRQRHAGKSAALNLGIKESSYEFLIMMDADTTLVPHSIKEIVKRMENQKTGAVSGIAKVRNKNTFLGMFQNVEYTYLQFIREVTAFIIGVSPGICGAFTCFRKEALIKAGGFSKNTSSEDFDIAFQIKKAGYKCFVEPNAVAYTITPSSLFGLFRQRIRWTKGIIQSVKLHRDMIGRHIPFSYVLGVHMFWYVIALLSIPLISYNILYWLPHNSSSVFDVAFYLFRWFSFAGIIHMIYMIPSWGINFVYFFGILAGIFTAGLMLLAMGRYGEIKNIKNFFGMFFYFPYTILLNLALIGGIAYYITKKGKGNFS